MTVINTPVIFLSPRARRIKTTCNDLGMSKKDLNGWKPQKIQSRRTYGKLTSNCRRTSRLPFPSSKGRRTWTIPTWVFEAPRTVLRLRNLRAVSAYLPFFSATCRRNGCGLRGNRSHPICGRTPHGRRCRTTTDSPSTWSTWCNCREPRVTHHEFVTEDNGLWGENNRTSRFWGSGFGNCPIAPKNQHPISSKPFSVKSTFS